MKLVDDLAQSLEMDEKSVYSHKVFKTVSIISCVAAAVMEVLCIVLYFVNAELGLYFYSMLFYPMAILLLITFFFSVPELLRNIYMSSLISLILASVMSIVLIVSIFLQAFLLGKVYIVPFLFL